MVKSKSQLAIELSKLKTFDKPKPELEQYATDSEIAADMLWTCGMHDNIHVVADLGAGTGILGLGAALLGAEKVYLVEKDPDAIKIAKENQALLEKKYGGLPIIYINADISEFNEKVDTVIMNPPFGIQTEHADKIFLETAMRVADKIYSIHKIESKEFIEKLSEEQNFLVKEILEFWFPLKATMKHHKERIRKVMVGCWVLEKV